MAKREARSRDAMLKKEAKASPENLLRTAADNRLPPPEADFEEAALYILKKNAELYRRLT